MTAPASDIIAATAAIARDPELAAAVRSGIAERGLRPERAVWESVAAIAAVYQGAGGRLAARAVDLNAVRDRLVAELTGRPVPGIPVSTTPFVLLAADLAPTEAAVLDPQLCLAIVTEQGGPTSHTAILARSLGIPAIVAAAGITSTANGTMVLVDGTTGDLIVDPDPEQRATAATTQQRTTVPDAGRTADGHAVPLLANVASADTVAAALEAGAEGVGLFRTEFCFLGRTEAPSLEEQIAAYRPVFAGFSGNKVVIRTLDAGADKPLPFVTADDEPNPALGVRGYRTRVAHPELLDAQLDAIAAAAAAEHAEVQVMAPMIATVDEAAEFAALCHEHGIATVGVMIETPSAAIMAREILAEVDFVSLGTNDLTQYTLAADRTLGSLAALGDPWQPSVLRLIRSVCEASSGKPVGVCGEAAADPQLAVVLVGLGVSSLSMSPRSRGPVATALKAVTLGQCRRRPVPHARRTPLSTPGLRPGHRSADVVVDPIEGLRDGLLPVRTKRSRSATSIFGSQRLSSCQFARRSSRFFQKPTASPAAYAAPSAVVSATTGRTTGTPRMSAWNCMSRLLAIMPPSTFSSSSGTPESALTASSTSRVWNAVASSTARAMWPLFTNRVSPTSAPRASDRQYGANRPENAGTKYAPPLSSTVFASASISSRRVIMPRLSRSHCTSGPVTAIEPSSA